MKKNKISNYMKRGVIEKIMILILAIALLYLLIALYFMNHFFINTLINGVDVSLKAYADIDDLFIPYTSEYQLQLIERKGEIEIIKGKDIGLHYNKKNSVTKIFKKQKSIMWISSLFQEQKYVVSDLFVYNKVQLVNKVNELECLNREIVEPQNVRFKFYNGKYELIKEIYGNKINRDKLLETIITSILKGSSMLDLDANLCYENPKYTINSDKTVRTKNLLNKYAAANITYLFGSKKEICDGNIINRWLHVNEDLDVVINEAEVLRYVQALGRKCDTVGTARNFKTSTGKMVEVKGGIYGWKIHADAEMQLLISMIKLGETVEKEPIYAQKAFSREIDDIGNTYVEVNITRQHVWFYKDGKLLTHGAVVTGNPNKGHSTKLGIYMLNYKIKGATLRGPGYEAEVTYWMPFYGNIGLHDASWRYSFGGEIYKLRGSHGCVNAPLYLAKKIYENIEEGTPFICYEE